MKAKKSLRVHENSRQTVGSLEGKGQKRRVLRSGAELDKYDTEKHHLILKRQCCGACNATNKDETYSHKGQRSKAIGIKPRVRSELDTIDGVKVDKKQRKENSSNYLDVTGNTAEQNKGLVKKVRHSKRVSFVRRPWDEDEDKAISELVKKYGPTRWSLIAKKLEEVYNIQGRTGKQCREM